MAQGQRPGAAGCKAVQELGRGSGALRNYRRPSYLPAGQPARRPMARLRPPKKKRASQRGNSFLFIKSSDLLVSYGTSRS